MFQRRRHILRRFQNLIDAVLTVTVFGAVYLFRDNLARISFLYDLGDLLRFEHYAPLMLIAALLWPITLNYHGLYDPTRLRKAFVNIGMIFRSSVESTLILMVIIFLFQIETISRLFLIGFGFTNAFVLIVKDLIRRQYALNKRLKERDIRSVLVVGTRESAAQMIRKIREESYLGIKVVAVVLPREEEGLQELEDVSIVGTLKDWRYVLHEHPVTSVIFTIHREYMNEVEEALSICQEEGVEAWLLANIFTWNLTRVEVDHFASTPILIFRTTPALTWPYITKMLVDRLLALFLFFLLSPLLLIISLCIFMTSGRPILYKQRRIGRFARPFELYKFRTFNIEGTKPTKFGLWLRNSSLDELTQLISVIPGLTCYRQISRPGKIPFDEALALDLKYIETWSLWSDFFLIFKTTASLLKRINLRKKGDACI